MAPQVIGRIFPDRFFQFIAIEACKLPPCAYIGCIAGKQYRFVMIVPAFYSFEAEKNHRSFLPDSAFFRADEKTGGPAEEIDPIAELRRGGRLICHQYESMLFVEYMM